MSPLTEALPPPHLGAEAKTKPLKEWVRRHAKRSAALLPNAQHRRAQNKSWKLYVNAKIEADAVRRDA